MTEYIKLDNLNTGAWYVRDRDNVLRFTITIDNNVNQRSLSVNVSAWDADNYGTPNEKVQAVVASFTKMKDRNA